MPCCRCRTSCPSSPWSASERCAIGKRAERRLYLESVLRLPGRREELSHFPEDRVVRGVGLDPVREAPPEVRVELLLDPLEVVERADAEEREVFAARLGSIVH